MRDGGCVENVLVLDRQKRFANRRCAGEAEEVWFAFLFDTLAPVP